MSKEKLSRRTRMWLENNPDLPDTLKKDLANAIEMQERKKVAELKEPSK